MTVVDLIQQLTHFNTALLIFLVALPIGVFIYWKSIGPYAGNDEPHQYVFATAVFLACIPGIFASVLTGYTLFFIHGNLLEVNLVIYLLPILSMIATLMITSRATNIERLPGFYRLRGLMSLLALTFILALLLIRFRVWLAFGGSFLSLALIMLGLFFGLRWSANRIFTRR